MVENKVTGILKVVLTVAEVNLILECKKLTDSLEFDGRTDPEDKVEIGKLITYLTGKFEIDENSVPEAIKSLSLQDMHINFCLREEQGSKVLSRFLFECKGKFSIEDIDFDTVVKIDLQRNVATGKLDPAFSGSLVLQLADGGSETFGVSFIGKGEDRIIHASWKSSEGHALTLGRIIETFVSWITGDVFGLSPPWDFINRMGFSSLDLDFNLTSKAVKFSCTINPIDFGFGTLSGISVSYVPAGEGKGVKVELQGSFLWMQKTSEPLGWDATKPDTTPAPPGGKFLDLRLLALGQHVGITDPDGTALKNITKVQDAIKALEGLPTDPDTLMEKLSAGSPIAFDPESSWLVAADFGILRFDESPPPVAPALIGTRSLVQTSPKSGYLLNLAVIFSDPNLYGLRLALDGPAAKIFKGLAFEIMYRKISDTMGVFQTKLNLPDAMRSFELGVFTITLPVLALEVYTNGDFKVDLGFPWKMDFARSFMIQGIIPPGIPLLGAGGLYFGKLSSGTSTQVPRAINGSFNPVIVFGLGLKLGVGKEIDKGVFKAGISITIVGIIEGVIAKWNPNTPALNSGEEKKDIQDSYYFWLQGTLGIVGKLFGSVDFGVVKAAVNVQLSLYAQITYESYADIPISVIASVSVSLNLVINLGLFKIKVNFSFSMTIKETLVIKNPQSNNPPPWQVASGGARAILRDKHAGRLRSILPAASAYRGAPALLWNNYEPTGERVNLKGYLVPVLTASGTEPCYVVTLLLDDPKKDLQVTSFQALCSQVLKWVVAASLSGDQMESIIDEHTVSEDDLTDILESCLANRDDGTSPIPLAHINSFMGRTFRLELEGLKPDTAGDDKEIEGIVFPMPPDLTIEVPAFNGSEGLRYRFSDCNKADRSSLKALREFFSRLAVQVEEEMKEEERMMLSSTPEYISMSTFVFEDYFLLLARQMVQMARDALRNLKYPVKEEDSINDILGWIGANGGNTDIGALTAQELMEANKEQKLKEDIVLTLGPEHILSSGDRLASISQNASLDIMQLASYNADNQDILQPGATITFADPIEGTIISCVIKCDDTLASLTQTLGLTLGQLVSIIEAVPSCGALNPTAKVYLPAISYRASLNDTLSSLADSFSQKYCRDISHSEEILQDLAVRNAWLEGILKPGTVIDINGKTHTVALEDSLHSLAQFFGYLPDRFAIFVNESNVKGAALNPLAPLMLPRISYKISEGESLGSISKSLGISIGTLAQNSDNLNIKGIFSPGAKINLPHLNQLKVKEILSHIQREGSIDHLAGMASRYMLHGISLPFQRLSCKASKGKTFNGIVDSYGDVFKLMDLIRANADLTDILQEGTELTLKDSSGKERIYAVKPGDSLRSIAVSISEVSESSPLSLEKLVQLTGLESKEDLLKPDADLVIPLITFNEPLNERAGLYELTGQQFQAPDLSAAGEYSFILYRGEETWIPIPDDGLKTVIKKDSANSLSRGYDRNLLAINNIQRSIGDWSNPAKADYDWWVNDIIDPQKLGIGAVYKLQPKKFPFSSMAIWQSPEDVLLYLVKSVKSDVGISAEKSRLKIWALPDSLAELTKGSSAIPEISLYTATFNEATSMTEEEMLGLYSWGTVIDFTVKKVASNPEYPATGLTYEILGANERGIALLESLLRNSQNTDGSIKDMAILYRTSRPGGGTNSLQSDGPLKQREDDSDEEEGDDNNKISTFIYQVNLTTATRPAENPVRSMAAPANQGRTFADLQYGQHRDYLRLLWEGSITRSGGYYIYYCRTGDSTGLPDAIFNDRGEAVISLLIIYDCKPIASYMNCAVTGDHLDQSRSVIFASCSSSSDCAESSGLSTRMPLVSPGVIPLEVKRRESTESNESNQDRRRLKNMFNMLSYSVNNSTYFEGSDLGLPMGPINNDDDVYWVYHQALPIQKLAKNKPNAIKIYNKEASQVFIEDPYYPIDSPTDGADPKTIELGLVWQDIFGNKIDEIPVHKCRIPIGYTDALMGLSQWPGMACHYVLLKDSYKSYFQIQFDFNLDNYLLKTYVFNWEDVPGIDNERLRIFLSEKYGLSWINISIISKSEDGKTINMSAGDNILSLTLNGEEVILKIDEIITATFAVKEENNELKIYTQPSKEEIEIAKDRAWHDLLAYARIYYQLQSATTSMETSLGLTNTADWAQKKGRSATDSVSLKDSLLKWIYNGSNSSIIGYLSECLKQGCTGTAPSKPETSLLMELDFNPDEISTEAIFRLTVDFVIMRNPSDIHPDLKKTESILRASTSISPLNSNYSLQDFAKSFEEATNIAESSLKIASGIDGQNSGSPSLWAVRIGHEDSTPASSINYSVYNPGLPSIYAPRPLFNTPVNLNGVAIRDYIPDTGKISEGATRTLNFVGVDVDAWMRIFLNGVEKFLSPEFATAIVILGEKKENSLIDTLLESKKAAAEYLSSLLVPALSNTAEGGLTEAQRIFKEDLLIHLSNFYGTEAAIQFDAFLNDEKLRLFGSVSPGTTTGKSISFTAAKIVPNATIENPPANASNAMLTFLLHKQEGQKREINDRLVELNPVYQITHMEHQIGAIQGIEDYESSSWLTFVNPIDPVLQNRLGSFEVPLLLRALPTPPSMIGQYGVPLSILSARDIPSELDIAMQFDYNLLYSQDYHEPQDDVDFTLEINKNPANATLRYPGEGIEYKLAEFITVYPDIEADLEEKLKGVSAGSEEIDGAFDALCSFVELVRTVTSTFQSINTTTSGSLPANNCQICKFSIREYASRQESGIDALAIDITIDVDWPEQIPHPEVLIEGYTRENNLYKKSDNSYLGASEGLKIPRRSVVIPSLNILKVQDITSSAKISRNDFKVRLNIASSGPEEKKDIDSPFIYTTSTVGFANPYRPFIESFKEVDISNIGLSNGQSRKKTLEEHLKALLTKLLADSAGSKLNLQLGCNYCFKVHREMPELSLPILLMPYRMVDEDNGIANLSQELSDLIIKWLNASLVRKDEGMLRFDLTVSTGMTETSMPLLKLHNLRLDSANISNFDIIE